MTVIAEVIDRHVEEAALAWLRRDRAVEEPHFKLVDLARLDGQLEAHIDGIRIAESDSPDATWRTCERELEWLEPGEVFPAAILAWESGNESRVRTVIAAAAKSHESSRALVSSLGWLSNEQAQPYIDQLLGHSRAFQRRVAIAACAAHRRNPGPALTNALASRDHLLKARALRAVGELGRRDLLPAAKAALRSRDRHVQFSAAWSLARLSDELPAITVLKKTVEAQLPDEFHALQMVLGRMEPAAAARWLNGLAQDSRSMRSAVIGAGIVGTPDAIGWLLAMMAAPEHARVAGEAFTMITGVDLAAAKLEGEWPEGFTAGPTEDPADDNVEMDQDENLPWPNAAKLAAWWDKHRGDFAPGVRHLCGRPLTEDWLEHELRHGYQRQRAAAALELSLRRPHEALFNVRAPGHRQQELLGLRPRPQTGNPPDSAARSVIV